MHPPRSRVLKTKLSENSAPLAGKGTDVYVYAHTRAHIHTLVCDKIMPWLTEKQLPELIWETLNYKNFFQFYILIPCHKT